MTNASVHHQAAVSRIHLQANGELAAIGLIVWHPCEVLYDHFWTQSCVHDLHFIIVGRNGHFIVVVAHGNVQWRSPHAWHKLTLMRRVRIPLDQDIFEAAGIEMAAGQCEGNRIHWRVMPMVQRCHRLGFDK